MKQLLGEEPGESQTWLLQPALRKKLGAALSAHNQAYPGSSTRIRRLALLSEPPSIDGHEISDKGTVNQSVAQRRRADDVEKLYAETPRDDVLVL